MMHYTIPYHTILYHTIPYCTTTYTYTYKMEPVNRKEKILNKHCPTPFFSSGFMLGCACHLHTLNISKNNRDIDPN